MKFFNFICFSYSTSRGRFYKECIILDWFTFSKIKGHSLKSENVLWHLSFSLMGFSQLGWQKVRVICVVQCEHIISVLWKLSLGVVTTRPSKDKKWFSIVVIVDLNSTPAMSWKVTMIWSTNLDAHSVRKLILLKNYWESTWEITMKTGKLRWNLKRKSLNVQFVQRSL